MNLVEKKYLEACEIPTDINEHLPVLKKYAEKCDHIIELGVRSIISTWAFLAGMPKRMVSIDLLLPKECGGDLAEVYKGAKEIEVAFSFILGNDLDIELEETDLLFIDTEHTYDQLKQELFLFHSKAKKYIIIHDTAIFEDILMPAVNDFLKVHKNWKVKEKLTNNNGLLVLDRRK